MSGPALNPIASIAPAAPPKGLDASNQDLSAQSEPDKAGSGFASELQRQMKGTPPPDEGQSAKSTSDTDADAAARLAYDDKLAKVHEIAKNNPRVVANLIKEWMGSNEQQR